MSLTHPSPLWRCLWRLVLAALTVPLPLHAVAQTASPVQFLDGWNAYQAGDYQKAVAVWTRLAEKGHVNAQVNLGFMYDHGTGISEDHRAAARWYRAAALQDSAAGQYNLSLLITEGHATPSADRSARYWMERAAAQGFVDARRALGRQIRQRGDIAETRAAMLPEHGAKTRLDFEQANAALVEVPVSIGTAWPIAAGYAVTSHHIIDGKQRVTLINNEGDELLAELIAGDASHDIAILRVTDPNRLPPALPLSPYRAQLGASVFTIGFPRIDIMGKSPKLSHGIVSAENGLRDDPRSYQISAPIQQGNSGGPLLNMRGEVVGMITTMLGERNPDGGPPRPIPNIGYALKTDVIRQFLVQVPRYASDIGELRPATANLEDLATRVKNSILTVMAE